MKKNFSERLITSCKNVSRKHKWAVRPVKYYMLTVLSVYHVGKWFASNGKRFSCAALLCLFLLVNSSFAVPDKTDSLSGVESFSVGGVLLTAEEELNEEEIASIEEEEEIDRSDDVELLENGEMDIYTLDEILMSNSNAAKYPEDKKIPVQKDEGIPQDYEEAVLDWRLILVNKQHSIPENYEFPLGTISGSMQCDSRILDDLLDMMQAARDDGVDLVICSPYRDFNRQTYLFNKKINRYMNAGMSYMDAYKTASVAVTSPNASEHRIGLAIDFYSSTYKSLDEGFADTDTGKWLKEHSCEYGFVLRYPKGKEYITGIEFEPWHFRYVGKTAATYMTENELTLEELWEEY